MITTSTVLTLSLAKAMGAYMIAGGISGFIAGERWNKMMVSFRDDPAITFMSGIFVYVMGVALILTHNVWTDPLAIVISLIGWVAAGEGLMLVAYPDPLIKLGFSFMRPGLVKGFATFTIVFGAVLLALGFTGTAGL